MELSGPDISICRLNDGTLRGSIMLDCYVIRWKLRRQNLRCYGCIRSLCLGDSVVQKKRLHVDLALIVIYLVLQVVLLSQWTCIYGVIARLSLVMQLILKVVELAIIMD